MSYVDGFVMVIPKKNIAAYKKMATVGKRVWRRHGALKYMEAVGDDLAVKFGTSLTKLTKAKKGETVVFAFIVYKSRAHRDAVNKKVMKDPELQTGCDPKDMPFDPKRMAWGGFKGLVES